ncbi:4-hydroxy-tetrahydrodipicolinate synthase [Atopostipes suicloacalis DSM 15692]|uniref:4-hydroxy-tetrahydrodipicolinate synthase n=1 Tax=Atopostipes suicloacalis DSM 15692 TaxID=1121025 RepID=A0A1M4YBZ8_9LACT|nr:dihydrodipicolinate synthase family protein [Atopostipes suicloacalis]SHF03106.1 4-hydroxy-tetrahydrodipicolinate synthase [Atopostipes suicloacalis DSM 15692]
MINREDIKGIIVPIVTPVDDNEDLDEQRMRKIVNHVIDTGVHGILAFGSNSEFYMFEDEEMLQALDIIIDETAGRVPVYFGMGAIRTRKAVELAQKAVNRDIAAVSILQPMFIQPTDKALYNHFETIAQSIPDTAVLLYNNPGRCGYGIPKQVISDLAHNVSNIVGIKDSSGDITFTSEIIRLTKDVDFKVLTGKDTVIYAGMCMGAVGSVCSTANMFGELVNSIYDLYIEGKYEEALEAQYKLNPIRLSQDGASFPAAAKDMSNLMGLDVGKSIRPTEATDGEVLKKMQEAMYEGGFLDLVE